MNDNIDLTKILKDCPKGTKLYSLVHGEVEFQKIELGPIYPISVRLNNNIVEIFTSEGKLLNNFDGECTLFPSKDQRDWSKFTAPWCKKEKFDPKMLKPFDRVLSRRNTTSIWQCGFFSHPHFKYQYFVGDCAYRFCIPYNDDTKQLLGTTDEAPKYYRYWED